MMPGAPDIIQQFGQMALSGMVRPQQNIVNRKELKAKMGQQPSIHVANLPKDNFLDLDLYKFFTSHKFKIRSAKVVLHNKTSKSLQYGYITFYTEDELERCLTQMNNFKLNGLPLCLTRCSGDPKAAQEEKKDANLLVKNVADSVQQKDLFNIFNSLGRVLSCKLEHHPETKQSKGFAYIQFEKVEDASKAL
jgi:RNA recognition motif-containing protein